MTNKKRTPPALKFRNIDPLEEYYMCGDDLYSVARLVSESKGLPVFDMPLSGLNLNDQTWDNMNLWGAAFHVHKVLEADLKHPIILDWNGCIADGRHRIIKAICAGHKTIKAVRITYKMQPESKDKD